MKTRRVLVRELPTITNPVKLTLKESKHLRQVLRLKSGDLVELINSNTGKSAIGALKFSSSVTIVELAQTDKPTSSPVESENQILPITLEISILKKDAMNLVVEKAVELGIKELTPIYTERSVIKLKNKEPELLQARWQRIADQALKQCGRLKKLIINNPVKLTNDILENTMGRRFWCKESANLNAKNLLTELENINTENKYFHLLVGPEGGWSPQEENLMENIKNTTPVSLGPLILRAETAAIFGLSVLNAALNSKKN